MRKTTGRTSTTKTTARGSGVPRASRAASTREQASRLIRGAPVTESVDEKEDARLRREVQAAMKRKAPPARRRQGP